MLSWHAAHRTLEIQTSTYACTSRAVAVHCSSEHPRRAITAYNRASEADHDAHECWHIAGIAHAKTPTDLIEPRGKPTSCDRRLNHDEDHMDLREVLLSHQARLEQVVQPLVQALFDVVETWLESVAGDNREGFEYRPSDGYQRTQSTSIGYLNDLVLLDPGAYFHVLVELGLRISRYVYRKGKCCAQRGSVVIDRGEGTCETWIRWAQAPYIVGCRPI
jgi:hypothetical protein